MPTLAWDRRLACVAAYAALFIVPVRVNVGPATLGPMDLAIFALGAWMLLRPRSGNPSLRFAVTLAALCYALAVALSLSLAFDVAAAMKELIKLTENFILYFAFAEILRRSTAPRKYEQAALIWMVAFIVIVVVSARMQIVFMRETVNPWLSPETARRYFRFGWGTNAYSNYFAGMLLLLIPFAVYGATMPGSPRRRRLSAVAGVVYAVSLVLTFSRGGLLTATLGMLAMAADSRAGRGLRIGMLAVGAAIATALVTLIPFGARIFTFSSGSVDDLSSSRTWIWRESLRHFEQSPLTGVGYGNFAIVSTAGEFGHNFIIQALVETGVLGAVAFVGLMYCVWEISRRAAVLRRGERDEWVFRATTIAVPVVLFHNLFENTIMGGVLYNYLFWPLLALPLGVVLEHAWQRAPGRDIPAHAPVAPA